MEQAVRKCLECNDLLRGRADQKFCSDACRNTFNNRANSDEIEVVRNINNILRKNRKILKGLLEISKIKVSRDLLLEKGFSFNYFTHLYNTKKGTCYHFCYDYGYLQLEQDLYFIVKTLKD